MTSETIAIDWNIVYSLITKHLDDFRDFIRAVSELQ